MNKVQLAFNEFWNSVIEHLPNILLAITILTVFLILGSVLKRIINNIISKQWDKSIATSFIGEFIKWIFIIIGIMIGFHVIGFGGVANSIVAGAGVSAIIFGFAFKDIAENFLAGIMLATNRPFQIKDIIESGGYKGPVRKIDLRATHIRTYDGKDIYIPNAMIMKNVLINYTRDGLFRHDFSIALDLNDDFNDVRKIILDYVIKQGDILKTPEPNVMVSKIEDHRIEVKTMFWVNIFDSRPKDDDQSIGEPIKSRVTNDVKELLMEKGYTLPAKIVENKDYRN